MADIDDLKSLLAFKADYVALMARAPTANIKGGMESILHDCVDDDIHVAEREITEAIESRAQGMYAGQGGSDPANRAAAYIEREMQKAGL